MNRIPVLCFGALLMMTCAASIASAQATERPAGLGEATAKPVPPFKIFDNLYYVGLDFVCAYVIQTSDGLILVDTLFGQYSDYTARAMQELGLNPRDVKYIVITHGHDDHIGQTIELAEKFGCPVVALLELRDWLSTQGLPDEATEAPNKGGTVDVEGIQVTLTDANHSTSAFENGTFTYLGEPCGLDARRSAFLERKAGFEEVARLAPQLGLRAQAAEGREQLRVAVDRLAAR